MALVRKVETKKLTTWGWLLVLSVLMLIAFLWVITIHNFLALNKPVNAPVIIIEGYVPDTVLIQVAANHSDQLIVCAGLPYEKGMMCRQYDNYADYNAAVILSTGVDSSMVISAPSKQTYRERTYTTALTAKYRLEQAGILPGNVDVVCYGTHARRTRLLYRKAFGPKWNVGVISCPSNLYEAGAWWRNSEGVRAVMYELFACIYCSLFFHP
jgi:hypothetical protein